MGRVRIIGRLDIKGPNLIKGINLEGLRVLGNPHNYAYKYYQQGIDELIFMDCVATLYGRNNLTDIISDSARDIFVPITVGGGIRSIQDAQQLFRSGADKVAINTAAVIRPQLLAEVATIFGSQSVVLSVEAKATDQGGWEAYTNNGRDKTGVDVVEWVKQAVALGVGEILLTSVDREGTRKGCDISLIKAVANVVDVPVVASGGVGNANDFIVAIKQGGADAVALADILHYERAVVADIRNSARDAGILVRNYLDD